MKRIAVFHPGTQHSWQTAMALDQLGMLEFYATSIFHQPDRWPYRAARYLPRPLSERMTREFRRFEQPGLDPAKVRTFGIDEWLERIAARLGHRKAAAWFDRTGNRRFAKSLRAHVHSDERFALWGFNSSSRGVFEAARERGRFCILDRTIGDWRVYNRAMDEVYAQYAEFFLSPDYHIPQATIDADDAEYQLADVILTGSPFAADTVRQNVAPVVADRVRVLNYCYDEALFANQPAPRPRSRSEPLRFLFVGQAGVRKGIHLVLKVFERVPASAASLTIVGDLQVPERVFARYADRVRYCPTVARADMPAIMRDADVFLFPTYFEGAGIVLYEALASGLGIIQSEHADIAVTSKTGTLMPEMSEEALYNAVMTAIENRVQVEEWRSNAQAEARRYSFADYRDNIATLLDEWAG